MIETWHAAGEEWKPLSSRIVLARVKVKPENIASVPAQPLFITIVNVYTPTHKSSQEKKDEFYQDLQDTISGVKWHCIDYVILRQKDRRLCSDVSVIRNADCWTDHKLLRAIFKIETPTRASKQCIQKKFAVSALINDENKAKYIKAVVGGIEASWCPDDDAESKWEMIRDSVMKAANDVLGLEGRQQPEWFGIINQPYNTLPSGTHCFIDGRGRTNKGTNRYMTM